MLRVVLFFFLLVFISGCVGPSYYFQSISGHVDLLARREPVQELLDDGVVAPRLKKQLRKSVALRYFAANSLLLPTDGTFTKYADLKRPFATWVVFATPAHSLQPKTWCFPVTGCLAYLGFFHEQQAEELGRELEEQGFDVYISGSPAYSTLGWFDDPLLNTFINWPEGRLAALMFHEMAHQKIYIAGDTTFNESYAQAVSRIGVRLWFEKLGEAQRLAEYDSYLLRKKRFFQTVQKLRKNLETLYASALDREDMELEKQKIFAQAAADSPDLAGGWFTRGLNNAKLSSVNTYNRLVENFVRIYEQSEKNGGNMAEFHGVIEQLSKRSKSERMDILQESNK